MKTSSLRKRYEGRKSISVWYRILFITGYLLILIYSFLKIGGNLNKVRVDLLAFELRLDHLLHMAVYFTLMLYMTAGEYLGLSLFRKNSLLKFIILLVFLGSITEFIQIWVPYRAFTLADWLSNMTGILLGYLVNLAAIHRRGSGTTDYGHV